VLFVSEKRAAVEVVTQRLEDIGLDHLVFDLHDQRLNRKQELAAWTWESRSPTSGLRACRLDHVTAD